jgi:hypothetical protein
MKTINFIAVLVGTFAFNTIFWKEDLAVNFAIFSLFSMLINFYNSPEMFSRRNVQITTAGNLISCFFLIYHHSLISMIAAVTTWVVMIGFYQQEELRTVHRALISSLLNFFRFPPFLTDYKRKGEGMSANQVERKIKTIFFPIVGLVVFYLIFLEANSVFKKMSDQFWHDIFWAFETFFAQISIERVLFLLLGFMLSTWFVYKAFHTFVLDNEKGKTLQLFRKRKAKKVYQTMHPNSMQQGLQLGLKTENRSGVLMMAMISILLLFINIIDIVYVWFGFDFDATKDFSADVHQGVNLLIFSIFLSIFIMIYFFRRNQNFYSKNKRLKQMAYFWIAQNVILIISVIFRNAHYINFHGLTQKRIGVFVFLSVVFVGLISLTFKIAERKSFFYLSKFNSWSLYGVLVFLACFNWDMIIFNHNFAKRDTKTIDLTYLVDLSDEVMLHIEKNKDVLFKEYKVNTRMLYSRSGYYNFERRLESIKNEMKYDNTTFFSWNYRKVKVNLMLKNIGNPLSDANESNRVFSSAKITPTKKQ